jgi:hypothetical protein
MNAPLSFRSSPGVIAWALFSGALVWYLSFWVLLTSGGNFLSHVPWPWLLVSAFVPVLNAGLAIAMHKALRDSGRAIKLREIIIVLIVTPHFFGAAYVWWGLLYYMGVL